MHQFPKAFGLIAAILIGFSAQSQTFTNFIDYLNSLPSTQRQAKVDSFMTTVQSGPIIENDSAVHFIYQESGVPSVSLVGELNAWTEDSMPLVMVGGTDFWYRSDTFATTARIGYLYHRDGFGIMDPLNNDECPTWSGTASELAMPEYEQPWEIDSIGAPQGAILSENVYSSNLDKTLEVKYYLPHDYDAVHRECGYPTVYFHDGDRYLNQGSAKNVLDNLIETDAIDPLIAVFVTPVNRGPEFVGDERFDYMKFISEELVPHVDTRFHTLDSNHFRMTAGVSNGGNISANLFLNHPETFRVLGLQSAVLYPNDDEIVVGFLTGTDYDVRFTSVYGTLEGLYDGWSMAIDTLSTVGYNPAYFNEVVKPEGHAWGLWRATIDDVLTFFLPKGSTPGECERTGVGELDNPAIRVFPNPGNDRLNIELEGEFVTSILNIRNAQGQIVRIETLDASTLTFDVSDLSVGIYYLEFSEPKRNCVIWTKSK